MLQIHQPYGRGMGSTGAQGAGSGMGKVHEGSFPQSQHLRAPKSLGAVENTYLLH